LLLFMSLSTQSGDFLIHLRSFPVPPYLYLLIQTERKFSTEFVGTSYTLSPCKMSHVQLNGILIMSYTAADILLYILQEADTTKSIN